MFYSFSAYPMMNISKNVRGGIFFLGILPSISTADELKPKDSHPLKPGLSAHAFDISDSQNNELQIIFIESQKTTKYAPHIIGGSGKIGSVRYNFPLTLSEINFDDAPVVVSGSYSGRFGGELEPLGYLKSNDIEISARFHHSWVVNAVFCADPRKATTLLYPVDPIASIIGNIPARKTFNSFNDCVQAGPQLFNDGKNTIEEDENSKSEPVQKYIETPRIQLFLCKTDFDPSSPLGIGITTDKIILTDLNKILPNLTIGDRKVCLNAVALSGSTAAGMLINGNLVAGSSSFLLTTAIAFVKSSEK